MQGRCQVAHAYCSSHHHPAGHRHILQELFMQLCHQQWGEGERGVTELREKAEKMEGMEYLGVQGKYGIGDVETLSWPVSAAALSVLPDLQSQGGAPWSQTCPGVYSTKVTISLDPQILVPHAHTNVTGVLPGTKAPPELNSHFCTAPCKYKGIPKDEWPRLHSSRPCCSSWSHPSQSTWGTVTLQARYSDHK